MFALIVDDDEPIRALMKKVLHRTNFHVHEARDGLEALDRMALVEYSVVLLDLMMPRMSGFEVMERLQAETPWKLSRVVVMTAASNLHLSRLDGSPVFATLRKPFDIEELKSVVINCAVQGMPPPETHVRIRPE